VKYPNLIIFSDGIPSRNGGGISQTLYNLFDTYPSDKITLLTDVNDYVESEETLLKGSVVKIRLNYFRPVRNRLAKFINPIFFILNCWVRELFGFGNKLKINDERTFFLISTSHLERLHYAYYASKKLGIPLVTYYMDDWMSSISRNWLTDNSKSFIKKTLKDSKGLILISHGLKKSLVEQYGIIFEKVLIAHNPISIQYYEKNEINTISNRFRIVYTGSIWPMHLDAIILVARAVSLLKLEGFSVDFIFYGKPIFWETYKNTLSPLAVAYGGFVDYRQMSDVLQNASVCLLATSYLSEYEAYAKTSVQTKITDYMAAGRPILSVGPDYAIGHEFIDKYNCGYSITDLEPISAAKKIGYLINNKEMLEEMGASSLKAVKTNFTKEVVQKKMYDYLIALSRS
jgi:glycosyltransferase involved in cell wall biosynthesis